MALKSFGAKVLKMFKEKPGVLFILCFLYIVYIIYCIASKSRKLFMKKCIYLWYSIESEKYFSLIFIINNVLRKRVREKQGHVEFGGTRGICPVPTPLGCFSGSVGDPAGGWARILLQFCPWWKKIMDSLWREFFLPSKDLWDIPDFSIETNLCYTEVSLTSL